MPKFKFLGATITPEYKNRINKVLEDVPVSGNSNSENVMALAHYSSNPHIEDFHVSGSFNWSGTLAFDHNTLHRVIGYDYKKFQSIYLIKLGANNENHSEGGGWGFMDEYRVHIKINRASFRKILIEYNHETSTYDLVD
ncbi:MAG: hypothetical protein JXR16_02025 [Bermanella sp.]